MRRIERMLDQLHWKVRPVEALEAHHQTLWFVHPLDPRHPTELSALEARLGARSGNGQLTRAEGGTRN